MTVRVGLTVCESKHRVPVGQDEGSWSRTVRSTAGASATQ